ncbi:HAD family hydrolase [Paenibacillus sedimenti]|uniref:HAD family phosphatase n=1 Tax=Paenibacillus sedimenti TaxID=2770274 RepID=A0A926QI45_9BACL|nr:HAD family phosphatase [Paenibacillus sedimenti]MBD0378957.1 HAD family phosphatase [Paenibacillus sedimenti]
MLKGFIFDMDGVIIDSEPIHFETDMQTMSHLGATITKEELEKFVGMTNPEMWKIIKQEYQLQQEIEDIIEYQVTLKVNLLRASLIEPIEGIRELISTLKKHRIPLGIASSSPRVFIEEVLRKFDLISSFDCVVSGEEVEQGKPAPHVYLEAAAMLGVEPASCVVVEDAKHGVAAAKAAGMTCFGFINPNSGNQDLSKADFIIHSIRDIKIENLM